MAKITVLLGELSGSIAGVTFARNKAGAYARQKVTPTDAKSIAQMSVRASFAQNSASFHALSPSEKATWNAFANSIFNPIHGREPGVTYTGQQAFVSLNQRLSNAVSRGVIPTTYVCCGMTPVSYDDFRNSTITTPPASNFNGSITSATGDPLNLTLFSVGLNSTSGVCSVNMDIVGNGGGGVIAPNQGNPPVIQTPDGSARVGFLVYGSDPVEQRGLAPANLYKNLLCAIPSVAELDDTSFTAGNTLNFTANVNTSQSINPRKAWYASGQTVRISVFSFNPQTGQTQPVGSNDCVVV